MPSLKKRVAIVGSGPAALMAAEVVSSVGHEVMVFEKRKGAGRKLLIAGSSGLNISNSLPLAEFLSHYSGPPATWKSIIGDFQPRDWIAFIEKELGIGTFEGTSGRYFVEEMKASKLLQSWMQRLRDRGVRFLFEHELTDFAREGEKILLRFTGATEPLGFDAACFCLGGGSYEPTENPLRWPRIFHDKGLEFEEFRPSNVGYRVAWSEPFLKEAEGQPLKNIVLTTRRGSRVGEAMITRYGIEGTPVYAVGVSGKATIDLKPGLSAEQILGKLQAVKENLSPMRRVKKQLNLGPAAIALVFHHAPAQALKGPALEPIARLLKAFPIELLEPQPLTEAISSAGGLKLSELDPSLMIRKVPGAFAAGEMLDWDTVTGGFLIQGCVAMGYRAGKGIVEYLR